MQRSLVFSLRTSRLSDPSFMTTVQQAVWAVNPNLPLARVRTLREIYDASMAQTSFTLVILGIAASVTLLLGLVGIYGVIAYVVAQRRREVGIRMALGAAAGEVQGLFVRHGLVITAIGLVVGVAAAAGVTRLISTLLFNVSPLDPLTYAGSIVGARHRRAARDVAPRPAGHTGGSGDCASRGIDRGRGRRFRGSRRFRVADSDSSGVPRRTAGTSELENLRNPDAEPSSR